MRKARVALTQHYLPGRVNPACAGTAPKRSLRQAPVQLRIKYAALREWKVKALHQSVKNFATAPERLEEVRQAIARAARDAGRGPEDVTLVCVSKTFAAAEIEPVLQAGQRVFGENRVQEAMEKWPSLREAWPGVELHLIGPLQSNKAHEAVQAVRRHRDRRSRQDRPRARGRNRKDGPPSEALRAGQYRGRTAEGRRPPRRRPTPSSRAAAKEHRLEIAGLMCIPPVDEQASPHFAMLNQIAARNGLKELSMGMSADFELAIQLGATHVRVGSAIFGTGSGAGKAAWRRSMPRRKSSKRPLPGPAPAGSADRAHRRRSRNAAIGWLWPERRAAAFSRKKSGKRRQASFLSPDGRTGDMSASRSFIAHSSDVAPSVWKGAAAAQILVTSATQPSVGANPSRTNPLPASDFCRAQWRKMALPRCLRRGEIL